jgi:uncharacterized protein YjbI with pentapeptide repeats
MPLDSSGKDFRGRDFRGQDLTVVNFANADIRGADFSNADLTRANFANADIRGADFSNADIRGANFSGARAGTQPRWFAALTIASSLLAGISGLSLGYVGNLLFRPRYLASAIEDVIYIPGLVASVILIAFLITAHRKGFGLALIIAMIEAAFLGVIASIFRLAPISESFIIVGTLTVSISGILASATAVAMSTAVNSLSGGIISTFMVVFCANISSLIGSHSYSDYSSLTAIFVSALALFSCYMGRNILAKDEQDNFIRAIAVGWSAVAGTSFRNANLTGVTFSHASLKHSDFRKAQLDYVDWQGAQNLHWARLGNSVLSNSAIRALLVTRNGHDKSYVKADLHHVNLQNINLVNANLRHADLSGADLRNADLSGSNLTEILAIGTNFTRANLTGACIQNWNINHATNLEDVDCRYVFLLEQHNELGSRERRPHNPSVSFEAGDFSKIFAGALSTINFIFSEGLDYEAFAEALRNVQSIAGYTELSLRSIERKDKGDVVLTLSNSVVGSDSSIVNNQSNQFVSIEPDKLEVERQLFETYQLLRQDVEEKYKAELESKVRELEVYRERLVTLEEIVGNISSRPIIIDVKQANEEN